MVRFRHALALGLIVLLGGQAIADEPDEARA